MLQVSKELLSLCYQIKNVLWPAFSHHLS